MPTSYEVIFLGISGIDIDPTEGNTSSENMGLLVGTTFGTQVNPLHHNVQTMSPVGSPGTLYDTNNNPDQFSVDGTTYRFDGWGVYNATITYTDGTTATIVAKIAQTTTGELYLVPEIAGLEANQALLEARPIQSITLNSTGAQGIGMTVDRLAGNFIEPVEGTAGNDNMNLGSGYTDAQGDQITTGNDYIDGGDGNDTINADAGNDTVLGGAGNDIIDDWGGNDIVYAGSGNDRVDLSIGNDTIFMGDGDDTVRVFDNSGNNSLDGGTGNDLLDFNNAQSSTGATVTVGPDGSGSFSHFSGATTGTFTGFETISGSAFNDSINAAANTSGIGLSGEAGNDILIGGSGQDQIDGGDGDDFVDAGGGNDSVIGGGGNDVAFGDEGNDTVSGGLGNDTIYGGGGGDSLTGGDGNDRIFGDNTTAAPVTVTNGTFATGTTAGWTVTGAGTVVDNQALAFNAANNGFGGTAQQTVATQAGFDYQLSFNTFENGSGSAEHTLVVEVIDAAGRVIGSQTIIVTNGSNQVVTVNFTATSANTTLRFSNPTSTGTSSTDVLIDNVTVTALPAPTTTGNDTINAGEGSDFVDAGGGDDLVTVDGTLTGDDTLDGGAGNDTLVLDPDNNRNLTVNMVTGTVADGAAGAQQFTNFENLVTADGNDSVTGGAGANLIQTQGGNDTVLGGDGNDTIEGGDGADNLAGGTGNDSILGGAGNDTLTGGSPAAFSGPELLVNGSFEAGLANNNWAYYTNGTLAGWQSGSGIIEIHSNGLNGYTAADGTNWAEIDADLAVDSIFQDITTPAGAPLTLTFQAQQRDAGQTQSIEVWFGGQLIDTIIPTTNVWQTYTYTVTGSGTDRLEFRELASENGAFGPFIDNVSLRQTVLPSDDTLSGGDGADSILGEGGNDSLSGDAGNDTVLGGDGNDTLLGGAGDDGLYGGEGNDSIVGGDNNDFIEGNAGNDTISGDAGDDNLRGGDGDDSILGGDGIDFITGDAGNDQLFGGLGNDNMRGGLGDDLMVGGDGDDFIAGDGGNDTLFGGAGIDNIQAGEGNDLVQAGSENDVVNGGTGADTLLGEAGDDLLTGADGDDRIEGGEGNDTLTADNNTGLGDSLFGGAGNDRLVDSTGTATLDGGTGSDIFELGYGNATVIGGEDAGNTDIDRIDFLPANDAVNILYTGNEAGTYTDFDGDTGQFSQIEQITLTNMADTVDASADTSGVDLIGNAGNDALTGGQGADVIDGGADNDSIAGGLGNDTLLGGSGADSLLGGDGNDSMTGDVGNDTVNGGAGNDAIDGGVGNDLLIGGDGSDTLLGGAGADTLTGGIGADVFVVGTDGDIITDFDVATGIQGGGAPDQTDNDFVDLSAYYNETTLAAWNAANPGNTYLRPIDWLRADHADDGALAEVGGLQIRGADGQPVAANRLNFENTGVICFANGTLIATPRGAIPVETLKQGDLVMTMDRGFQPLRWIGARRFDAEDFRSNPKLRPIRIRKGATGIAEQSRDLLLSPQHRVLVASKVAQRMAGASEVLVAAVQLLGLEGIGIADDVEEVTYFHLLFDAHEIVFANGVPSESLYLGGQARATLTDEALEEIRTIFPEVMAPHFKPRPCRPFLEGRQARTLGKRHSKNRKPLQDTFRLSDEVAQMNRVWLATG